MAIWRRRKWKRKENKYAMKICNVKAMAWKPKIGGAVKRKQTYRKRPSGGGISVAGESEEEAGWKEKACRIRKWRNKCNGISEEALANNSKKIEMKLSNRRNQEAIWRINVAWK